MINFDNTYIKLPNSFYSESKPDAAIKPELITLNEELAEYLGISLEQESAKDIFSGLSIPENTTPIALAYSGHQFGHFNPQLGDGRAVLLGEVVAKDGKRFDIQLKGSGQTKFSRRGDGRSSLGPVIREYIVSEAMYHLGIPSTRALCAVTTGDSVRRETLLPGGIFTRVASSHIRIGTFEYFSHRGELENLKLLADYTIDRHYPQVKESDSPYLELFKAVAKNKLRLVSKWLGVGFIHGVMNTDNTSITGETIDFGPCAFIDQFENTKCLSSIDRNGRYAYNNQGNMALWNLTSLANCLIQIMDGEIEDNVDVLNSELAQLVKYFEDQRLKVFARKLGIKDPTIDDNALIADYLQYLEDNELDFTNSFRELAQMGSSKLGIHTRIFERNSGPTSEVVELMNSSNPYIIPRNHQVEKAIQQAYSGNYDHFFKMIEAFKNPYQSNEDFRDFTLLPAENEVVHATFCGT